MLGHKKSLGRKGMGLQKDFLNQTDLRQRPGQVKGSQTQTTPAASQGAHSPEKVLSAKRNSKLLLPTPAGEKAGDERAHGSLPLTQSFREMAPKC